MSFKFLEKKLLDHALNITAYTASTTIHCALFSVVATDAAAGTECTGGGYARASTPTASWNAATGSSPATVDNAGNIDFVTASSDYVANPIQVCIFTASTAGDNLAFSASFAAVDINSGDTPRISAGNLDVTLD